MSGAECRLLVFFWGDPSPYIVEAHRQHTKVFVQVGSVEEATAAAATIVQGVEAGGHVKSRTSLSTLVPAVVDAVSPVPVLAAGGIATGRGVVAALTLGAQAVSMGTRFLCSAEAAATRPAVYLHTADKYRRLTRRPAQEQKGLDERARMVS